MQRSLGARARGSLSVGVDMVTRALLVRKAAGQPVPPPKLIYAIIGKGMPGSAPFRYAMIGQQTYEMIQALLLRNGITIEGDVLDFGCGSGRVIRWFHDHPGKVVGTDYNPGLIAWCERHLEGFSFDVNDLDPPLHYADDRFELVYSTSIFTHLDESRQHTWLRELARVTARGGVLVVTTHGTRYWSDLTVAERERFTAGEIIIHNAEKQVGSNVFGTFQSEDNFKTVVDGAGLAVVDYLPWGAFGGRGQDLWLLKRR